MEDHFAVYLHTVSVSYFNKPNSMDDTLWRPEMEHHARGSSVSRDQSLVV